MMTCSKRRIIFEWKSTDDIDSESGVLEASYSEPVSYAISSIAVAIFLVVTFAGGDLRGSVALLLAWDRYYMVLGLAIFASFALLVLASISALFFLGSDDVSFVVGAAAVLFISDLDEKLWAVLRSVNNNYRLFWGFEIAVLSKALAVMSILWLGETKATTTGWAGDDSASIINGDDQSSFVIEQKNVEYFQGYIYDTFFACFLNPVGGTICAWEVAAGLQYIAGRWLDSNQPMRSPKMKYFLWLEAFFLCELGIHVYVALSERSSRFNFYTSSFSLVCNSLPATLTVVGAVGMLLPPCKLLTHLNRDVFEVLVGVGIGRALFVGSNYVAMKITIDPVLLSIFGVVSLTAISVLLVIAIFKTFESFPARFIVLAWRLPCTSSPIGDVGDEEASTIVGAAFVAGCIYVRLHVIEMLWFAVYLGGMDI